MHTFFASTLQHHYRNLERQRDRLLQLSNVDPLTIQFDLQRAIFELTKEIGSLCPSASPFFDHSDWLQPYLPGLSSEGDAYWKYEGPRVQVEYDELLLLPDTLVVVGMSDRAYLHRVFSIVVGSVRATMTCEAAMPEEDEALLRSIGKIAVEHEAYDRKYLNC